MASREGRAARELQPAGPRAAVGELRGARIEGWRGWRASAGMDRMAARTASTGRNKKSEDVCRRRGTA
ncbi:hypothetical protein [Oryza sativa Japonica Group]|uniref:Uncharacterized protein n=1 Tax=Oryza sativa subsp. japonica TaxID=39947 RepID=Q5SMS1_ORYSJ|nr:hypothetical protein [Oryza sativa Japonica Group]